MVEPLIHGKACEDVMWLLCAAAGPIALPACPRSEQAENQSEDSDDGLTAEGDELSETAAALKRRGAVGATAVNGAALHADAARLEDLLRDVAPEAASAGGAPSVDAESASDIQRRSIADFLRHTDAPAEDGLLLFPGEGACGLAFSASFEGGNLRRVRRLSSGHIELLLNDDTKRKGRGSWFFFDLFSSAAQDVRLCIVSCTSSNSTYMDGQRIVALREACGSAWERAGFDYAYYPNRYVMGSQSTAGPCHYTLAFTLRLEPGRTRLANCYPYLFGDLLADLRALRPSSEWVGYQDLGPTLGGRKLVKLVIASPQPASAPPREHIVISARVHPGETPAAYMMRGVLELLLSHGEEARQLRDRFVWVLFPMLNPDGVALGNSRANSLGMDLNRRW